MLVLIVKLFSIAFFLNLLYELFHSVLYKTCLEASGRTYRYLMLKAALFDAAAISLIWIVSLKNLIAFVLIALTFAYAWEIIAIKKKRWEYTAAMPKVLGVGVTPLVQLAATGVVAVLLIK